jgi:hypothetical protein
VNDAQQVDDPERPGARPGPPSRLQVQADLRIDVDGVPARLTAEGDRLTLRSSRPERVWAAAPALAGRVAGPRWVGRAADVLAGAGLTVDVVGPQGVVVSLGDGAGSRLGRAVTGSSAVRPGAPAAVVGSAWRWVRLVTRPAAATAGLVVLVALVGVLVRRRGRA